MLQTFNFIRKSSKFRRSEAMACLDSGAGRKYSGVTRVSALSGKKHSCAPLQQKLHIFK